jgi:hypothetical protein
MTVSAAPNAGYVFVAKRFGFTGVGLGVGLGSIRTPCDWREGGI